MLSSLVPKAIVALVLVLATLAAVSCGDSEPLPDIDAIHVSEGQVVGAKVDISFPPAP